MGAPAAQAHQVSSKAHLARSVGKPSPARSLALGLRPGPRAAERAAGAPLAGLAARARGAAAAGTASRPAALALGAAPAKPQQPARHGEQAPAAHSFARVLQSTIRPQAQDHSAQAALLETLRRVVAQAVGTLKGHDDPKVAEREKAFKEILDDAKLTPRQKAARLKALLAEVLPGLASQVGPTDTPRHPGPVATQQSPVALVSAAPAARKSAEPRVYVLDLRKSAEDKAARPAVAAPASPAERTASSLGALQKAFPDAQSVSADRAPHGNRAASPATPLERLREMAGSELARAAGIIVRDGGSGEIRLVLKPESLGSVRVRLNLADNVIEGRIIVDSPEVKHILDGSIDNLTRALTAEGFQTASLSVSVGGGETDPGKQEREATPVRRIEAASGFAAAIPEAESLSWDELLVNLFA